MDNSNSADEHHLKQFAELSGFDDIKISATRIGETPRKLSFTFTELHRCGVFSRIDGRLVAVWHCDKQFEGSASPENWVTILVPIGKNDLPAHEVDCCPLHARPDVHKPLIELWKIRKGI